MKANQSKKTAKNNPDQSGSSYANRYRYQVKAPKLPQQMPKSSNHLPVSDYKALDAEIDRELKMMMDENGSEKKHINIEQQNNEEQMMYEEFEEMEKHYEQELNEICEAIAIIEEECDKEKEKVKEAENSLKLKKKELHEIRVQYETSIRTSAQSQNDNLDQVVTL